MEKFRRITVSVFLLFFSLTAGSYAKPQVFVDGGTADVRVLMQKGVPYVSASDIAAAFGKQFQYANGKLVFGSQGGANAQEGQIVEYGKWGFNGKVRVRVVKVDHNTFCGAYGGSDLITLEFANGMTRPTDLSHIQLEFYHNGQLIGQSQRANSSQSNSALFLQLGKGAHTVQTYCAWGPGIDLINVKFNPTNEPKYKYLNGPMMKLKVAEPESGSQSEGQ